MAIINKQIVTSSGNGNENIIHPETSAFMTKMTGFSSLSSLSGLIADTDNALQALKKLQTNIQGIKVFTGTNGTSTGISGLVPAPTINDKNKFLKSDGTWSNLGVTSVAVADSANKLTEPVNLQTNLSSNIASSFDGSSNTSIGVSGILPIANGGTNATTAKDARKSIFGDEMVSANSKYFITINEGYSTGGYLSVANAKSVLGINNVNNTADSSKTVAKANALTNSINLVTDLASSGTVSFNGSQNTAIGITGVLPITNGGTGESSLSNIKAGKDSDGNTINITYAKLSGATFTGDVKANTKFIGTLEGNASTASKFQSAQEGTADQFRNVWFSDNTDDNKRVYNARFQYNPVSNILKVGNISGNADTASRFIADVSVITNLASSNSAILNGTSNISPGVTGILGTTNGGTGQSSLANVSGIGNAVNSNYPKGFDNYSTTATWGNQTGSVITNWKKGGGDIAFRYNPDSQQINVVTDGFFYQNEGKQLVLDTNNYTNYTPTKTGSGASGTWAINISGNAATATTATTAEYANKLSSSFTILTNLASTNSSSYDGNSTSITAGVTGTLPVTNGGTGQTAVYNNTSIGALGWSSTTGARVVTANTIAYWNGAYSNTSSNLAYCSKGAFGSIVTCNSPLPVANGGTGQTSLTKVTAGKANELYTSRNIDGIAFNGSAPVNHYAECSTSAGASAKSVDCPNFILEKGSRISILFTITNTANNPTLNVNSTGAKPIYYRGYPLPASALQANSLYDLIYNGSQWLIVGSVLWTE